MMGNGFANQIKFSHKIKVFGLKVLVFFVAFFTFIYVLFPNKLLKAYIVSEIQLAAAQAGLPINVDMESANFYWFTGLHFKDVSVTNMFDTLQKTLVIPDVTVRLSVLPLLIGRAHVNASIDLDDGTSDFYTSVSLFDLINSNVNNFKIQAEFDNFAVHNIAEQTFEILESFNEPAVLLLKPILSKLNVGGFLNGELKFVRKNAKDNGFINLDFDKFYFDLDDKSLNIPRQNFKKAAFEAFWENSVYTIADKTTFESENLFFMPKGSVKVVGTGASAVPVLNLDILLILSGEIEKNFGFLVPQLLKCQSSAMTGGVLNVRLVGPLSQYTCE